MRESARDHWTMPNKTDPPSVTGTPANAPAQPQQPAVEGEAEDAKQRSEEIKKVRWRIEHGDEYIARLLKTIKERLPELEKLLAEAEDHWGMEDGVYRFYHQSFKVYYLQSLTETICAALRNLLSDRPLNEWFREIGAQGTGKTSDVSHNENWLQHTRPIVEAFFHAHYFLKMACKY